MSYTTLNSTSESYRSSWCEIDLVQFRRNLAALRKVTDTKALLVVKANAYGHGLTAIASEAVAAGIDMLGVATITEAERLLSIQVPVPILIMCALDTREIDWCVANEVHFLAWRRDHFADATAAAAKYARRPYIHLEVDTGMSRSGVDASDFVSLVGSLSSRVRGTIVGLASHFFSADLEDLNDSDRQLQEFLQCAKLAEEMGIRPLLHIANSPAALRLHNSRLGLTRFGIAAYGLLPSDYAPLPEGVAPLLTWKARLTNVKIIFPGRGVGYGWKYVAHDSERVATLGIGYADGYRRSPEGVNTVIVGGLEARVVGSVCMDQCVIRLPSHSSFQVGDTAVLLGRDSGHSLSAGELAKRWHTNNYDVVAGIRDRVPRIYLVDPS